MRTAAACLAVSVLALGACSPKGDQGSAPAAPSAAGAVAGAKAALTGQPPKPKVGVWETTMNMGGAAPMKVSSQVCIDAAMLSGDAWLKNNQKSGSAPDCQQTVQGTLSGYTVDSVCKMAGRTMITHGVASGDFNTAYVMDMTTRMDPSPPGRPAETRMQISARYLGPCPAGQAGGPIAGSIKMAPAG